MNIFCSIRSNKISFGFSSFARGQIQQQDQPKEKKDNDGTLFEEIEENRGQRDLEVMERKGVFSKKLKG